MNAVKAEVSLYPELIFKQAVAEEKTQGVLKMANFWFRVFKRFSHTVAHVVRVQASLLAGHRMLLLLLRRYQPVKTVEVDEQNSIGEVVWLRLRGAVVTRDHCGSWHLKVAVPGRVRSW